jgi:hypothetical protein
VNYLAIPTFLIAAFLFGLGVCQARQKVGGLARICQWLLGGIIAVPGVVFTVYYLKVFGEPMWLYRFRTLQFAELTAGGAGFLAGLLFERVRSDRRIHRFVGPWFLAVLLALGFAAPYLKPVAMPPRWSQFRDRWSEGVCLQTSASSCGPACAATLLRGGGRSVTEEQIARESFTSRTGTEVWYLARTLRRHGAETEFVFQPDNVRPWPVPSIAGVRYPSMGNTGHFIVVLAQIGNDYVIGDPMIGKIVESQADLARSYHFTGFFLVLK